jgi:hypothetical protein
VLFANLCYGRNYFSKKIIRGLFSCKILLHYITYYEESQGKHIKLPNPIRAAMIYILMHAHIDSKPRIEKNYPIMTHFMAPKKEYQVEEGAFSSAAKRGIEAL